MAHSKSKGEILPEHAGVLVTATTALCSATMATAEAILQRKKLPIMGGVRGACMGFICSSGMVGLTHLRQKDDYWNFTIPVTVATTVDGFAFWPRRFFPVAASLGVLFGGAMFGTLSLLDKFYFNKNNNNKDLATATATHSLEDGNQFEKLN